MTPIKTPKHKHTWVASSGSDDEPEISGPSVDLKCLSCGTHARLSIKQFCIHLLDRTKGLYTHIKLLSEINQNITVGNQAAWIEWRHGEGAEHGMQWIENGLSGPGLIPGEDEPYGKEPQAYFNINKHDPFPECFCGRPSGQLWMGLGSCCDEHHKITKEKWKADEAIPSGTRIN